MESLRHGDVRSAADLSTPVSGLCWQRMRKRTAIAPYIATALVIAIALPCAAAQEHGRSSLAVLDFAVSDRSPLPDAAATRAQLAASGKTPAQWLAQAVASFDAYQLVDPARIAAVQNDCSAA